MFVYALYREMREARKAVHALLDVGFSAANVSVLMRDGRDVVERVIALRASGGRGAVIGGILGCAGGALLAPLTGWPAGVLFGPLAEGILFGGTVGAAMGMLGGMAFFRDEIELPRPRRLGDGMIVVGVATRSRVDLARSVLRSTGGRGVREQTTEGAVRQLRARGAFNQEHAYLRTLFEDLLAELEAGKNVRAGIADAEAALEEHFDAEERLLFAPLVPSDEALVRALTAEHRSLLRILAEVAEGVDHGAAPVERFRAFLAQLDAHAQREEETTYRSIGEIGDEGFGWIDAVLHSPPHLPERLRPRSKRAAH